MPSNQIVVGVQSNSDSSTPVTARGGRQGDALVSGLHGPAYEQNFRGFVFADGLATVQAITAATYNISTLGNTCTPIIGLYNPSTSGVNAVLIRAVLNTIKTALQNTGCGPFFWATSVGNTALTLGTAPLNRKTLVRAGSACKGMSGIALTGLTNNLVVQFGSGLFGGASGLAAFLETQVGSASSPASSEEVFKGDFIVPPGGVIALLAGSAPVAVSAASLLVWEEVPVA